MISLNASGENSFTSIVCICRCLNFFMDPLLHGGDPGLAGLLLANIKKTVDAQDPENTETCTVTTFLF